MDKGTNKHLEEMQNSLKEVVDDVFYGRKFLDVFSEEDKSKLMSLANAGDTHAICVLLGGMKWKEHSWPEKAVDEDTNEEVEVLHREIIVGETTFKKEEGEEEALMQKLFDAKESMSDEELDMARGILPDDIDITPLDLELVRRGKEYAASMIRNPKVLLDLCEKGNKYAARELYVKYRWGDEEHGIFIDKEKARIYYDMIGNVLKECYKWDDCDDPGEENPSNYEYILTGDAATLNAVQTLINDLCQRFGTPGNEFGMFVPQRILMKVLVGADTEYYRGNILEMEGPSPIGGGKEGACLVITTEADRGEPLLYALRQAFTNLNVEVK